MSLKKILSEIDFSLNTSEINLIEKKAKELVNEIKKELKIQKINAEVFIGGSLAKKTMVRKEANDIDIFVRFDLKYDHLSTLLESIVKNVAEKNNFSVEKIHGSRDYFALKKEKENIFEIIPVLKVSNPKKAQNVTDLSYFHVNYVKNKINKNKELARQITLTKAFCKACGVYGAESYISGISGYGIECLMISYGSFEKMAKAFVKSKEKLIIDPEKKYKKKTDIFVEMNESKLKGPIVLVDPTFKERNVLAALSKESFEKMCAAIRELLEKPSKDLFYEEKIDEKKWNIVAKEKSADFNKLVLSTEKQEGDIAGTKMKKFYKMLLGVIKENFEIMAENFVYESGQKAEAYLITKKLNEKVRQGPPVKMTESALSFRKANKKVFEKDGRLFAVENLDFSFADFINDYKKKYAKKIREMDVSLLEIQKD